VILSSIELPPTSRAYLPRRNKLSARDREFIIRRSKTTGGHLGSNLGVVETDQFALHRVFESPKDICCGIPVTRLTSTSCSPVAATASRVYASAVVSRAIPIAQRASTTGSNLARLDGPLLRPWPLGALEQKKDSSDTGGQRHVRGDRRRRVHSRVELPTKPLNNLAFDISA